MKLSPFRFHSAEEIERTERTDLETRRRDERLRLAMNGQWPEIPRGRLEFGRHHVADTATGEFFLVHGGDIGAPTTPIVSYFVDSDGDPVFLEPANPPNRAELERRQAAKEQHRRDQDAARKSHYAELRKAAGR